ncbi:hypothetical protein KJ742_03550 [Patescibacteria group bacterium]|nr:hypothetical protein [Patescibacteria group bacterium]MBU1682996.1 hypothetical protein [Patescibacteria group bacterium]
MKNLFKNFIDLLFNKRFTFFAGGEAPEADVDWGETGEGMDVGAVPDYAAGDELAAEKFAEAETEAVEETAKGAAAAAAEDLGEITIKRGGEVVETSEMTQEDKIKADPRLKVISDRIDEAELRGAPEAELAELKTEYDRMFTQVQTEMAARTPTRREPTGMPEFEPGPTVMSALNRALQSGNLDDNQVALLNKTKTIQRDVAPYFEQMANMRGLSPEDKATLSDLRGAVDTLVEMGQYENANSLMAHLETRMAYFKTLDDDISRREYLTRVARTVRTWVERAKTA